MSFGLIILHISCVNCFQYAIFCTSTETLETVHTAAPTIVYYLKLLTPVITPGLSTPAVFHLYSEASSTYPGSLSVTCFTNPNNRDRAKRYHKGGYQLGKSTLIQQGAWSHERSAVCSIWPITYMKSTDSREAHFTNKEQTLILDEYKAVKHIII